MVEILTFFGRGPLLQERGRGVRGRMGPRKRVLNGSGWGSNEAAAMRKCREERGENNVLTPSGADLTIV